MCNPPLLSRRQFSLMGGAAIAVAHAEAASAFKSLVRNEESTGCPLIFIASARGAIDVLLPSRPSSSAGWRLVHSVACEKPSALALSPCQRFLYAANAVNNANNRFAGAVSAFAIDSSTGGLSLIDRQPLAVSAVRPEIFTIAPDGSRLLVAATGGSSYNLLPIRSDGSFVGVSASLKQVGVGFTSDGEDRPSPCAVAFAGNHRVFGVNSACDRLSSMTVDEEGALTQNQWNEVATGYGFSQLAVHPNRNVIYVSGSTKPILCSFRIGQDERVSLHSKVIIKTGDAGIRSLAMHPSGALLFASNHSGIWMIRANADGAIGLCGVTKTVTNYLAMSRNGRYLYSVGVNGDLHQFSIDADEKAFRDKVTLYQARAPVALAVRSL